MSFLLRTLSLSYLGRHRLKTLLTLLGVMVGVATFTAIRSARATLIDGLKGTVDRMAGKAHLQISSDAGVPEQMQELLHELEGVRAQAPVIQQVVVPARAELGSLLVLGVDLLGDREMRDYGFEGEEADLDDPLLFLARPDSVALTRSFAERAGLQPGDSFELGAPQGPKLVVVRALLEPEGFAEAYGGNLAVMDVYAAQELFGRGRRFDRLEVRLEPAVTLARGQEILERAIGPGYRIETPERRGAQLEKLVSNFVVGFTISSVFALGIGTFLIFNAFSVAVNRRRRDIGTLRALGATPRQVQALFLLEAAWIGLAGGLLGLVAGAALTRGILRVMGETVAAVYGLSEGSAARLDPAVVLQSLALGLLASLAGAFAPSRQAARVHPTEALAQGRFQTRAAPVSRRRWLAGAVTLAASLAIARAAALPGMARFLGALALGLLGAVLLIGPAARLLVRALVPLVGRLAPVSGRLAADSLASNPRRTSSTVVAMTLSLAFVLGTSGYMHSTRAALERWMEDILTSDLYVRASANLTRPDFRFPADLRAEIASLPGVRAVESFRAMRLPFRDDEVMLLTIEIEPTLARTRHEYLEGDADSMRRGLVERGEAAVSDNFHRRFGLGVGDVVELSSPGGVVSFPIAAVVTEYSSDRGSLYLDRARFVALWGDDRVDTYDVSLAPGADPEAVRAAVRARIGGRYPALISTREEFRAEIGRAVDGFYVLTRITVFLALVVAFLGIVSSLLISVVERSREIGILKALGALGGQIRRAVVFEALAVALVALVLALPLGELDARFLSTTVAEVFAGWSMPHRYSPATLLQLLVALPVVSALAAWLPARAAAATPVTEAIEYE